MSTIFYSLLLTPAVGKSLLGKDLKKCAHDLWKLLTAFCRHPADTSKQFPRLAELLAAVLKKYSFMQESVALALKVILLCLLTSNNTCSKFCGGFAVIAEGPP